MGPKSLEQTTKTSIFFSLRNRPNRTCPKLPLRFASYGTVSGGTDSSPVSDNDMASFVQLATGYKRLVVLTLDLGITNKDIRSTYSPRSIWPYCERRFRFPP